MGCYFRQPLSPVLTQGLPANCGTNPPAAMLVRNAQGQIDPSIDPFPPEGPPPGVELPPWLDGKPWTSDLLFAYHAVAASYAASKVNLVRPGTYDLYPWLGDPRNPGYPYQIDPDWDGATWKTHCTEYGGWLGIDTTLLQTGYTRPDLNKYWTISVRAKKNHDPGSIYPALDYYSTLFQAGGTSIRLALDSDPPVPYDYGQVRTWHFSENEFFNDNRVNPVDTNIWHTYTMAGWNIYVDGVLLPTSSPGALTPYTTDWGGFIPIPNELGFGASMIWGPPDSSYLRTMGGVQWMTSMVGINRVLSGAEVAALVAVQP